MEVEEVDGNFGGGGAGLWSLLPSALAPSWMGIGARGFFAGMWASG